MKFQDHSDEELGVIEQFRQALIAHRSAITPYDFVNIKEAPTRNHLAVEDAFQHMQSLGILKKNPPVGVSDPRQFDLTDLGKSKLSLIQMKEREIEDEKKLTEAQKDQLRTNKHNRRSMWFSVGIAALALAVSIVALILKAG